MGANKNSFKQLMDAEEVTFPPPSIVEKKVTSSINFLEFFGKIIELFVPKIMDLFIVMTGGTVQQLQEAEPINLLEESGEPNADDDDIPGDSIA